MVGKGLPVGRKHPRYDALKDEEWQYTEERPHPDDLMLNAIRDVAEALRDAIGVVAGSRIGQIGASQVYTPQINVERVEMWREALAGFSGGADDRDAADGD